MTQVRARRSGVEDLWFDAKRLPTKLNGKGSRWRARYVDDLGKEYTKRFARKADANSWLDGQTSSIVTGSHVAPKDARITVEQWCDK